MAVSLSVDFETRSAINVNDVGVYRYAEHPTTDLWCAVFGFDDEPAIRWRRGEPLPERVAEHVRAGREMRAWNADFERVVWYLILGPRYGWPVPAMDQWYCTQAEAAAMNLPLALGKAAAALNVDVQKDAAGRRLMLQMTKPRKPLKAWPERNPDDPHGLYWWDDPEKLDALVEYCARDVDTERAVARRCRRLSDAERETYLLTQTMNDRGVPVDMDLVEAASALVEEGQRRASALLEEMTDGLVTSTTQHARLKQWLADSGYEVSDTQKATVRDMLAEEGIRDDVRDVLEVWSDTAKTSTAKLAKILGSVNRDGRVRGGQQYHGAGTGRFAGRGVQPHNFPRPALKFPKGEPGIERYIPAVLARDYDALEKLAPPVVVVSDMLRLMLKAKPGFVFRSADYSQIEARVLAWLAEQDDLVELFASGGKVYEEMAAATFDMDVDDIGKDSFERQVGKNTVLGCGFQMGGDRFEEQFQEQTGIVLEPTPCPCGGKGKGTLPGGQYACWDCKDTGMVKFGAKAVRAYRERFPRIRQFWPDIDAAAKRAVAEPGSIIPVGRNNAVRFVVRGKFLWCLLPSGRALGYAQPRIVKVKVFKRDAWQLQYNAVDGFSRKWTRQGTYGGRLTENVVQAIARDVMVEGMKRVEAAGYPVVLTVHDEVLAHAPVGHGSQEEFEALMRERPAWAAGCPIECEGWEGERYRK